MRTPGRMHLGECLALAAAFGWSSSLFAIATLLPLYEGSSTEQPAGHSEVTTHYSRTLVEENGSGVLMVVGVPMILTICVAIALWVRGARRGAGFFAWSITGLLIAFNLVSMLSIGIAFLPVTGCVVAACILHRSRGVDAPQVVLHA